MYVNYEMVLFAGVVAVSLYSLRHWFALRNREFDRSAKKSFSATSTDSVSVADRKRAVMHYRVELMRKENKLLERRQAEERAIHLVEDFSIGESLKLKNAVAAAKQGASSEMISDRYEITENEAELIVSIHGTRINVVSDKVH